MMQLTYLLPHLDAEIKRLQKARDLLALISESHVSPWDETETNMPTLSRTFAQQSSSSFTGLHQEGVEQATKPDSALIGPTSQAAADVKSAEIIPRRVQRKRRVSNLHSESKVARRKRVILEDTALSGSVPSGPVVVSAEQVRKSQALKAAEAVRMAEVKKAGSDPASSLGWRSRATDVRSVDALLQRLINRGADDGDQAATGQISSHQ
jgi:hypothetical protein